MKTTDDTSTAHAEEPVRVSVVVALISGEVEPLRRCLRSLARQRPDPPAEILVPCFDTDAAPAALRDELPGVRFVTAGAGRPVSCGGSREHHDTLRTAGLREATSPIVALVEDHVIVDEAWCARISAAFSRHPTAAVVGGPVECQSPHALNWAVWCCDFGRYQMPLPEQRTEYLSDSNVAYRRGALDRVSEAWRADYHETSVHWAMRDAGLELFAIPDAIVHQARPRLTFRRAVLERYVWGRSFAGTRARLIGNRRWLFACLTPLLPFVLTWRLARISMGRRRHASRFLSHWPIVFALECVWSAGECAGYVTAAPD